MKNTKKVIDKQIVLENERHAKKAYEQGDYILCFLLIHTLVESLLRSFLTKTGKEIFSELVEAYSEFLKSDGQIGVTFETELTEFNRRRNRVVHKLWKNGYTKTNGQIEPACRSAFIMYGLFIEWLETFDPEITEFGFEYEG